MSAATALVTGASGGLGAAVAGTLAADGYQVALHSFANRSGAEAVAEKLDVPTAVVTADVRSWEAVRSMCDEVAAQLGPVEVLVNCAGRRDDSLMAGQSPEAWRDVVDVNLVGTFHTCRAVLPIMLRRREGHIVNVVSPAGTRGSAGQTAYSASKAGVVGLTRSLAHECGRRSVTVNALSPGYMETGMTADLPSDVKAALASRVPLGRITTPGEVAEAVRFIIASAYMTGQVLTIDGGMTA